MLDKLKTMDKKVLFSNTIRKIIFIVSGIIGILLLRFLLSYGYKQSAAYQLNQIVSAINKNSYSSADKYTTFNRAELHHRVIQMDYRVNDDFPIEAGSDLKNSIKKTANVLKDYFIIIMKIDSYSKILQKYNVTIIHRYYDKHYNLLLEIAIKPEDYADNK